MKKRANYYLFISFAAAIFFISCKKENPCLGCGSTGSGGNGGSANKPPVAHAGSHQFITLPTDSVLLSGSTSSDPDGTITSFSWTKTSGPSSFTIVNPNAEQTWAKQLIPGIYTFELTVKDNGGLSAKASIAITVYPSFCNIENRPQVAAQLIAVNNLSIARGSMTIASAGNKILYAGGYTGSASSGWQFYSRVDIFDINTNTWTTSELSQARWGMATAVLGNKIFFAGGVSAVGTYTTRVDIYDAAANTWSASELSSGGTEITGAAAGDKVLFAGGVRGLVSYSKIVDIYDNSTGTWSTTSLNRPGDAVGMTATVIENKIYFAGDASDWWAWDFGTISSTINIYDAVTNTWATSDMTMPRGYLAGIAVGNKNYWAGGLYQQPQTNSGPFTNLVEIRDMSTGTPSFGCLFQPNAFFSAVEKTNKIVFFTSGIGNSPSSWQEIPRVLNKFDIYDITTGSWSIGVLPVNIYGSNIISVNNTIYVAGGYVNDALSSQVWKLEF